MIQFSDTETILPGNRQNKKNIPKDVVLKKLKKGDVIAKENKNGTMIVKWKSTCDVELLSTKHAPTMEGYIKATAICNYNKGKGGIAISNQMCSYATTLSK
ncbi:hypothetical protein PR048_018047, partial [Dryococelus australis]